MPLTETRTIPEDAIRERFLQRPSENRSLRLAKETALALLMQPAGMGAASAGEFLVEVDDDGISRPLVDFEAIRIAPCMISSTRIAQSLSPMQLSKEDASQIESAIKHRSARPRIQSKRLPELES